MRVATVRLRIDRRPRGPVVLAAVALGLLLGLLLSFSVYGDGNSARPSPLRAAAPVAAKVIDPSGPATSVGELGTAASEVVVGTALSLSWQALLSGGGRATSFSAAANVTVVASANGSTLPAWVNSSSAGSLERLAGGSFSVPASAWSAGVLTLTVSVATAAPATVLLEGPALPSVPAPIQVSVLPDLDHLVLYDPTYPAPGGTAAVNDTFYLVRDRFHDPTPGALLFVEYATGLSQSTSIVPVTWTPDGATGAWINYSVPENGTGTLRVTDAANETLLGPVTILAMAPPPAPGAANLPPVVLAAVALLAVGAIVGMAVLVLGGRARPPDGSAEGEEELRRLAEGRATVVEIVREGGPLGIAEIEARWEPPPAPAAVADWVASLVTDGTLTATIGEGGRARFVLAERPVEAATVTLDEDALEREIARRDAAVDDGADERP